MLWSFGNVTAALCCFFSHTVVVDKIAKRLVLCSHKAGIYRINVRVRVCECFFKVMRNIANYRRQWLRESAVCIDDRREAKWRQTYRVEQRPLRPRLPMLHVRRRRYEPTSGDVGVLSSVCLAWSIYLEHVTDWIQADFYHVIFHQ
jgi:hypothetical protein